MKQAVIGLAILALIVWIGIGIGLAQRYFENKYERTCHVYSSSEDYDRWECPGETFYRHK